MKRAALLAVLVLASCVRVPDYPPSGAYPNTPRGTSVNGLSGQRAICRFADLVCVDSAVAAGANQFWCKVPNAQGYTQPCPIGLQSMPREHSLHAFLAYAGRPHKRFCAEVERLGWYDDPLMRYLSSDKFGLFSPDPNYAPNPRNSDFHPNAADTTNCFCFSEKRQQVLAVCPADPWRMKGEPMPAWFIRHRETVNPLTN